MASILLINPNTVSKAYRLISDEGLIEFTKDKFYRVISDNIVIQKIRAEEVQILSCNFARGMVELGFTKEESLDFIKAYIKR